MNDVHPRPWRPRSWLPVLGALGLPILWLCNQQLNYRLVGWACRTGNVWVFHAVSAAMVVLAGAYVFAMARHWRATRDHEHDLMDTVPHRRHMFVTIALGLGALFTVAIVLQWIPTLLLGPCHR